jgi:pSer/pThr/pTyr-binding forkhead associated (FHA) protein
MKASDPPENPPRRRALTMLESVDEIRAQVQRARTLKESIAAVTPAPVAAVTPAPVDDTAPFRPSSRPSMAVLLILDDSDDEGETVRIRGASYVIGRVQGDLIIPHDGNISGRHAEIQRRLEGGKYHWYLRDLQSTNGTYVRVASGILRDGQEMLIGGPGYRFEAPLSGEPDAVASPGGAGATRKWIGGSLEQMAASGHPTLVQLTPQGEGRRFSLNRAEHWIGRDPSQCSIVLDDPLVSPRHARIYQDPKGRWMIQNNRSLNGLWMRITEIPLEKGGQFQCGEQRFLIRIL